MVKVLLDLGANPNREQNGMVPVVLAANQKDIRICLALMNAGCSLNRSGMQTLGTSQTPLGMAIAAGMDDAVTTLLFLGSDVNAKTDWSVGSSHRNKAFFLRPGSSMLHFSVYKRNVGIAKKLIECGADINSVDSEYYTALHLACEDESGQIHMARFLLSAAKKDVMDTIPINT
ncbi:MAG: hypothetical protein CEE42_16245 [Promethearchaeota archaeon Loki_b31]|nr:MAG: hypothetical protein CEE42_16245 [Candidatus Lokiarchaeota archaeon Loki_b31]